MCGYMGIVISGSNVVSSLAEMNRGGMAARSSYSGVRGDVGKVDVGFR